MKPNHSDAPQSEHDTQLPKSIAVVAFATILFGSISASGNEQHPDDTSRMKGVWAIEGITSFGLPSSLAWSPAEIQFEDGKMTVMFVGPTVQKDLVHKVTINPKTTPKTIDITRSNGAKKETLRGIYKFDGEKLMICFMRRLDRSPSDERPHTFVSNPTVKSDLLILKHKAISSDKASAKSLDEAR